MTKNRIRISALIGALVLTNLPVKGMSAFFNQDPKNSYNVHINSGDAVKAAEIVAKMAATHMPKKFPEIPREALEFLTSNKIQIDSKDLRDFNPTVRLQLDQSTIDFLNSVTELLKEAGPIKMPELNLFDKPLKVECVLSAETHARLNALIQQTFLSLGGLSLAIGSAAYIVLSAKSPHQQMHSQTVLDGLITAAPGAVGFALGISLIIYASC